MRERDRRGDRDRAGDLDLDRDLLRLLNLLVHQAVGVGVLWSYPDEAERDRLLISLSQAVGDPCGPLQLSQHPALATTHPWQHE